MNLEAAARRAAKRHHIDPDVFVAQIRQESGFRTDVTSGSNAHGIAQFIPSTAKAYGVNLNDGNPLDDLDGAARYDSDLLKRAGGDYRGMLSGYNSGRTDAYKDPNFAHGQTYNYVRSIMGAAGGGGRAVAQGGVTRHDTPTPGPTPGGNVPDFKLARRAMLLSYLQDRHNPDALLGLASNLQGLKEQEQASTSVPSVASQSPQETTISPQQGYGSGTVTFDGKPVRADFAKQLAWARQNGWKGSVTSGFRTPSQQMAAAKGFGLQHYGPNGPLGSNHVTGHQGAVDVSDPNSLDNLLRRYPGKRTLIRGMADDPVHFSPTGH